MSIYIVLFLGGSLSKTYVVEYVREYSTVVLGCEFKSISGKITWIARDKNNKTKTLADGKTLKSGIENIKIVGNHTNGEYNLELQRITKADEKIYKCFTTFNQTIYEFEISVCISSK